METIKVRYKLDTETIHPKYGLLEPGKEYEVEPNDLKNSALFEEVLVNRIIESISFGESIKKEEKINMDIYPKIGKYPKMREVK